MIGRSSASVLPRSAECPYEEKEAMEAQFWQGRVTITRMEFDDRKEVDDENDRDDVRRQTTTL